MGEIIKMGVDNDPNKAVRDAEFEKIEKIKASLNNLTNKKSKFLFTVPESNNPAASIYEIYFHATIVKKMGYEVIILTEKKDYEIPKWIEKTLTDITHVSMAENSITITPEDVMIISDVYSNVMEQTKNLPCQRIGFLQSLDYMANALVPGTDWASFGIRDIITTSKELKNIINVFYGEGKFNIGTYDVGIPNYFKQSGKPKKPIISVIGRNPNEISKFVKLFYSKFPQYSWITFDPMLTKSKPPQPMRRKDFAERLEQNFAAVWIDRISSFGTFPLECMKSGVIPICLRPDIMPEYLIERKDDESVEIIENAGLWSSNFYDLPLILGDVLVKFLDDSIGDNIYDAMNRVSAKYTPENSEKTVIEYYNTILTNRITMLSGVVDKNLEALKNNDDEKNTKDGKSE